MYDLSDKTVLVTGASKGIGASIARICGLAGAAVIAHYGTDLAGAEQATTLIPQSRKKLISADFSDLGSVEELWQAAERWRGGIDVLVNNAATMAWNGGVDQPLSIWDAVWDETLRINVLAPARLLRRAVRHFLERGHGTVITISSWAAQIRGYKSSYHCVWGIQGGYTKCDSDHCPSIRRSRHSSLCHCPGSRPNQIVRTVCHHPRWRESYN